MSESDVARCLKMALENELADERRHAVHRIASSRYLNREVVVDGLSVIARTDTSLSVRCAAVAALGKSEHAGAAAVLVRVLHQPFTPQRTVSGSGIDVRWDALRAILTLLERGVFPGDELDALREPAVDLLGKDRSREVRQTAARVLGYLPDRQVLEPLIDGLEQRDFGVAYESERSLMRLTGHTFDYDPVRWREWLAETENPFADAGRLEGALNPPPENWWRRSWRRTQQGLATFRPKSDDS
ncbi:MAG: HEAT repeat domain-containing protein [bacterium]|nr:HEAT repeat domain-containing protein [bacterium]